MLLDVHGHPPAMWRPNEVENVEQMERAYIDGLVRFDARAVISQLRPGPGAPADLLPWERPHAGNAYVADLVRRFPDRLLGYCTTHPRYTAQALAELELRLVKQRDQFAGLKMHSLAFCDDPLYDPLMEVCAAHDVPVLQHTFKQVGPDGPGSGNFPFEATPERLLTLARRHPKVKFFGGHGGGDWEWGVAAWKQVDNIWLDMTAAKPLLASWTWRCVGWGRAGSSSAPTSGAAPSPRKSHASSPATSRTRTKSACAGATPSRYSATDFRPAGGSISPNDRANDTGHEPYG